MLKIKFIHTISIRLGLDSEFLDQLNFLKKIKAIWSQVADEFGQGYQYVVTDYKS